ncbi:MAG: hypothetical protein ACPGXZ_04555 [Saprospiraceae bacterium]
MKKNQIFSILILLFLTPFFTNTLYAQKVKIKKKVVSVNKQPYCKTNCGGAFTQDCKIKNLDGETLISLVLHEYQTGEATNNVYEITFVGTKYTAQKDASFSFTKKLIREFYKYEVITDGQLNDAGIQKFVKEYNEDLKGKYAEREAKYLGKTVVRESSNNKKAVEHKLIDRKRSANILIFGEEIQQDFKTIGRYELENSMEGTIIQQNFSFYLPDGTLIATATMAEFSKTGSCKIVTTKDNEEHLVTIKAKDKMAKAKEMTSFLVKRIYL